MNLSMDKPGTGPACDLRSDCRTEADQEFVKNLFDRPWDTFVVRREADGKYRSYTECCGYLSPA